MRLRRRCPRPVKAPEPQPRLIIRLPGRYMFGRTAISDPDDMDATPSHESDNDMLSPLRPRHEVSYVPGSPVMPLRSGVRLDTITFRPKGHHDQS